MDMQARRDAFALLTDERPPNEPKRWLVMWGEALNGEWRTFGSEVAAWHFARTELDGWWISVRDLDNQ